MARYLVKPDPCCSALPNHGPKEPLRSIAHRVLVL